MAEELPILKGILKGNFSYHNARKCENNIFKWQNEIKQKKNEKEHSSLLFDWNNWKTKPQIICNCAKLHWLMILRRLRWNCERISVNSCGHWSPMIHAHKFRIKLEKEFRCGAWWTVNFWIMDAHRTTTTKNPC